LGPRAFPEKKQETIESRFEKVAHSQAAEGDAQHRLSGQPHLLHMASNLSTKRFGARYGRKLRAKYAQVEGVQRARQKCPYCNKMAVKRVALGIWDCARCNIKFTGKAYTAV